MEDIKNLLKEHLKLKMGHPEEDSAHFNYDIALEVYWDNELIAKADSIYNYIEV